jgi:hypothetical protein
LHLSGRKAAAGAKRHKKEEAALARQKILPRLMKFTFITLKNQKEQISFTSYDASGRGYGWLC